MDTIEQPKPTEMPPMTAEQITRIKCGMTALMTRIYCREVHHTINGELCPECERFFEGAERRVKACRFAAENRPCPMCPDCCFKGDMHGMLMARAMYFQQHGGEHQDEVQRIMADGLAER